MKVINHIPRSGSIRDIRTTDHVHQQHFNNFHQGKLNGKLISMNSVDALLDTGYYYNQIKK